MWVTPLLWSFLSPGGNGLLGTSAGNGWGARERVQAVTEALAGEGMLGLGCIVYPTSSSSSPKAQAPLTVP